MGNLLQNKQHQPSVIKFGTDNTKHSSFSSFKIQSSPSTVFIGDLPKDTSLVELYEYLRKVVGGDFELVLKRYYITFDLTFSRPAGKYFYYAFCRFSDVYLGTYATLLNISLI